MSQLTGHVSTNLDLAQDGGPQSVASVITSAGLAAIAANQAQQPASVGATVKVFTAATGSGNNTYNVLPSDDVLAVDATAIAAVIDLPLASAGARKLYVTKKDAIAHNVTITAAGSDTFIGGGATLALTARGDFAILVSDGVSEWYIFGDLLT